MKKSTSKKGQISSKEFSYTNNSGRRVFTIPEIMRVAHVTRRQINYWEKNGLLKSTFKDLKTRTGNISSFFPKTEVIKVLIYCEMKERGFSTQQIQKVARNLASIKLNLEKSGAYILSDGYSVYFAENEREVIDILKHARQMLLVPIQEQLDKLKKVA